MRTLFWLDSALPCLCHCGSVFATWAFGRACTWGRFESRFFNITYHNSSAPRVPPTPLPEKKTPRLVWLTGTQREEDGPQEGQNLVGILIQKEVGSPRSAFLFKESPQLLLCVGHRSSISCPWAGPTETTRVQTGSLRT